MLTRILLLHVLSQKVEISLSWSLEGGREGGAEEEMLWFQDQMIPPTELYLCEHSAEGTRGEVAFARLMLGLARPCRVSLKPRPGVFGG